MSEATVSPRPAKGDRTPKPVRRIFLNVRMRLACWEWPRDGAPLAILIHGSRDHARSWDAVAALLRQGYHVVAVDLRGHGDSAWSEDGRYDHAAYMSDLVALCDALGVSEDRPTVLLGHSLGAHIALRFAGAMPSLVSRLVAIEATGAPAQADLARAAMPIDQRLSGWLDERDQARIKEPQLLASIAEAAERMALRHAFLTTAQASHLARHGVRRCRGGWRWKHDPYLSAWPFPELEPAEAEALWRRVACPTLLIFGDRSWPSPVPERLAHIVGNAQVLRLPESGHWPHHDALGTCLATIAEFLDVLLPC